VIINFYNLHELHPKQSKPAYPSLASQLHSKTANRTIQTPTNRFFLLNIDYQELSSLDSEIQVQMTQTDTKISTMGTAAPSPQDEKALG